MASRSKMWVVVGIAVVVALSSFGVHGGGSVSTATAPSAAVRPVGLELSHTGSAHPSAPAALGPNAAKALAILNNIPQSTLSMSPVAEEALKESKTSGPNASIILPPTGPASSRQIRAATESGYINPEPRPSPAAMGVTDFGLRTQPNGTIVPYVLNSSSLFADLNVKSIVPNELFSGRPSYYGLQLNAVTTNVTVGGQSGYQYWAQNVFHYDTFAHSITLVTNVWNFSAGPLGVCGTPSTGGCPLGGNVFYATGPLGAQGNFVYAAGEVICCVNYPFDVQLYTNSTVVAGRNTINFTANIESGGVKHSYPSWDYVIFNSTAGGGAPVSSPSPFTADGTQYDPIGLPNDFEAVFVGPSGGDTTNFIGANATLSLQYWNATAGRYESVPSAYDFSGETGETTYGASFAWTTGPNGPGGANTYAVVTDGGSELKGLWNASSPQGATPVVIDVTPSSALVFLNQSSSNTTENEAAWAPTVLSNSFELSPGTYSLSLMLAGYTPFTEVLTVGASAVTVTETLTADPALGAYVPIYVWSNSQLAAMSSSGSGTDTSPYMLVDGQGAVMPAVFGQLNDYFFPVFSGVWFYGTTAWTELYQPSTFETAVADPGVPATNELPYDFYDTSHVAIVGATDISGWVTGYGAWPTQTYASMVFWNSSNNLVANDVFEPQSGGLYLYGGTQNYIWGNYLENGPIPAPGANISTQPNVIGIIEWESGDWFYNNVVNTTITGVELNYDPSTFTGLNINNVWNTSRQPATNVNFAPAWPNFPLTGSIIGTPDQGGNAWYNYPSANNPAGVLPYDNIDPANCPGFPCILTGGDYDPLVPVVGFSVTFTESGLPPQTTWSVSLNGAFNSSIGQTNVFTGIVSGSYTFAVTNIPAGYTATPSSGTISVTSALGRTIVFTAPASRTGSISGTVSPANAAVSVNGAALIVTGAGTFTTSTVTGVASIVAGASGYYTYYNNVTVTSGGTAQLSIVLDPLAPTAPGNGTIDATVSPATATVTLNGQAIAVGAYGDFTAKLAPGVYTIVATASGYLTGTRVVTVVSGLTTSVPAIDLQAVPTSSGGGSSSSSGQIGPLEWGLIGVLAALAAIFLITTLIFMGRGRRPPADDTEPDAEGSESAEEPEPDSEET